MKVIEVVIRPLQPDNDFATAPAQPESTGAPLRRSGPWPGWWKTVGPGFDMFVRWAAFVDPCEPSRILTFLVRSTTRLCNPWITHDRQLFT